MKKIKILINDIKTKWLMQKVKKATRLVAKLNNALNKQIEIYAKITNMEANNETNDN